MSSSTATLLYLLTFAACGAFACTYFTVTLAFDYEFEPAVIASAAVSVTVILLLLLVLHTLNEWKRRQFWETLLLPPPTYCPAGCPYDYRPVVATTPNGGMA